MYNEKKPLVSEEFRRKIHAHIQVKQPDVSKQAPAYQAALRYAARNQDATILEAVDAGIRETSRVAAPVVETPAPVVADVPTFEVYLRELACVQDRAFQPDIFITNTADGITIEFRPSDMPWATFKVAGDKLTPVAEI